MEGEQPVQRQSHGQQPLKPRTCVLKHCPDETIPLSSFFLDVDIYRQLFKLVGIVLSLDTVLILIIANKHKAFSIPNTETVTFTVDEVIMAFFGAGE